jgi:deazaflavin-dependent oxidoreductase (nitroreductase family)
MKRVLSVLAAVVLAGGVGAAVLVTIVRSKPPRGLSVVRHTNKALWNRVTVKSGGAPGSSVSLLRHVGRTSGRAYVTPVGAQRVDDGFVIALTYGHQTDWLRNVLATGSATLVHQGVEYQVDRPEVCPMAEHASAFGRADRTGFRVLNITECLHLRVAPA